VPTATAAGGIQDDLAGAALGLRELEALMLAGVGLELVEVAVLVRVVVRQAGDGGEAGAGRE
jgi:hypothetical protein